MKTNISQDGDLYKMFKYLALIWRFLATREGPAVASMKLQANNNNIGDWEKKQN
jgi:hypothetical protein